MNIDKVFIIGVGFTDTGIAQAAVTSGFSVTVVPFAERH